MIRVKFNEREIDQLDAFYQTVTEVDSNFDHFYH